MRRNLQTGDSGFAMPMVLFAVMVLMGVATVLGAAAVNEMRSTANSRDFESAMHAAEAGAERVVARTNKDIRYGTTQWPSPAPADERAWAISVAQAAPASERLVRDNGWSYGIRPYSMATDPFDVIYGVGYIKGPVGEEYRVIKMRVTAGIYRPKHAILTEGRLQMHGSAVFGEEGSVHSNKEQKLLGTPTIEQGATASLLGSEPGSWKDLAGTPYDATLVPTEVVPQIAAVSFYETRLDPSYSGSWFLTTPRPAVATYDGEWFDMCIELGQPNATVRVPAEPGGAPCTGAVYRSLPRVGCGSSDSQPEGFFRGWHAHNDHWHLCDPLESGIFFTSGEGPIEMAGDYPEGPPVPVTIISDNGIKMKGERNFVPRLPGYLFQAEDDIVIEGEHTLSGLIASREDIVVKGATTLNGALLSNNKSGGLTNVLDWQITYNGDVNVPLGGVVNINAFNEL